jgi:hypothetical protein
MASATPEHAPADIVTFSQRLEAGTTPCPIFGSGKSYRHGQGETSSRLAVLNQPRFVA